MVYLSSSDNPEHEALALLTSTYGDAFSELVGAILGEAGDSSDEPAQSLANQISALKDLLLGMTLIARTLVANWAKEADVDEPEILEALGRYFHSQTPDE